MSANKLDFQTQFNSIISFYKEQYPCTVFILTNRNIVFRVFLKNHTVKVKLKLSVYFLPAAWCHLTFLNLKLS